MSSHSSRSRRGGRRFGIAASGVAAGVFIASLLSPAAAGAAPERGATAVPAGAMVSAQSPAGACVPGQVYSVSAEGVLRLLEFDDDGTLQHSTELERFEIAKGNVVNALALSPSGLRLTAVETGASGQDALSVYSVMDANLKSGESKGKSQPGFKLSESNFTTLAIVAGAYDSFNRYYVGGFAETSDGGVAFNLFRVLGSGKTYVHVGELELNNEFFANGDMAFDLAGNLHVVESWDDGDEAIARIHRIDADQLTSESTAVKRLEATTIAQIRNDGAAEIINGIAFDGLGRAFLGSESWIRPYDTDDWAPVGGLMDIASGALNPANSSDLASCATPPTLTVQKNVVARANADDQFALSVWTDRAGTNEVSTATTSGSTAGDQSAVIGPVSVRAGREYWFGERVSTGDALDYSASWECVLTGTEERIGTGSGASGSVTMPANSNAPVTCTITNTPLTVEVEIQKHIMSEEAGAPSQTREGWTVGLGVGEATGGLQLVSPAETPWQQTGSNGSAYWTGRFTGPDDFATLLVSEKESDDYAFRTGNCRITPLDGEASWTSLGKAVDARIEGIRPGDRVFCMLGNSLRPPQLTLKKAIEFGDERVIPDFRLAATGPAGARPGPAGTSGSPEATNVAVTAGEPYTLSSTATGRDEYIPASPQPWTCVDQTGADLPLDGDGAITLSAGRRVVCTETSTTGQIVLLKEVRGGTLPASAWRVSATPAPGDGIGLPVVTAGGAGAQGSANTFFVRPEHDYRLAERPAEDGVSLSYRLVGLERLAEGGDPTEPDDWRRVDDPAAPQRVAAGETAVFRFVNEPRPMLTLPATGGAGADIFTIAGLGLAGLVVATAAVTTLRRRAAVTDEPS